MAKEKLDEIKRQIAAGNTERAIELLVAYTEETESPQHSDALLLSGHYRQWQRQVTMGVEQSSSELRRIELAIMDILDKKSKRLRNGGNSPKSTVTPAPAPRRPEPTPPRRPEPAGRNYTPFLIGGGLLLLVLVAWFMAGGDDAPRNSTPVTNTETPTVGATGTDATSPSTEENAADSPEGTPTTTAPTRRRDLNGLTGPDVRLITLTNLRDGNTPKFLRRVPRPEWASARTYDNYTFWRGERASLETFTFLVQTDADENAMYFAFGQLEGEAKIDLNTGVYTSSQIINDTPFTGGGRVDYYVTEITAENAAVVTYNDPANGNPYRIRLSYQTEWFRDSGNSTRVLSEYEELDRSAGIITLREKRSGRVYILDLNDRKLRYRDGDEPEMVYADLTGVY